jgi:amino acid adenylation domain-containing protein
VKRGPTTFAQEALWIHERLLAGDDVLPYNETFVISVDGVLDRGLVEASLNAIVARHEALRTTFELDDGLPRQVVHPPYEVRLQELVVDEEADVDREACALASRAFDLAQGPLVRFRLVRIGSERSAVLVAAHHLIIDGRSIEIIASELDRAYGALSRGGPISLPPLESDVVAYARFEREDFGRRESSLLPFWRAALREPVGDISLPVERQSRSMSFRGARASITLPADILTQIRQLASRRASSPSTVAHAALHATLGRLSQSASVTTGISISTRDRVTWEPLVGMLLDTVVLRSDLGGDPSFEDFVGHVRDVTLDAVSHRLPFERLVAALRPRRESGQSPFFRVHFGFQPRERASRCVGPHRAEIRIPFRGVARFDLNVSLFEGPDDQLHGFVDYRLDRFDRHVVERFIAAYRSVLIHGLRSPTTALSALDLLDEAERKRILIDWNDAARIDLGPRRRLDRLFEEQVARTPDAIAVIACGESLTYAQLDARANDLAGRLSRGALGRDSLVVVDLDRSLDAIVAALGIWKAGAAYLPLERRHPVKRLEEMISETRPTALVGFEDRFGLVACPPRASADAGALGGGEPCSFDDVKRSADDERLAYVICSSGSTGRPNAIAIEHHSAANTLRSLNRRFSVARGDRILLVSSLAFDLSVYEMIGPLLVGATVVVPDGEELTDPDRLIALIAEHRISLWSSAPALLDMVVERALGRADLPLASLRLALVGGDWIPARLPNRIRHVAPGMRLINLGGATECSIHSTAFEVDLDSTAAPPRLAYGRPLDNQRAYILDNRQQPLPVGFPGELYLGGASVGRGYLGRPDLTAARFLPDPFAPGGRMYRTGDSARLCEDGELELLGRLDHMVKLHGMRVELGEIETRLRRHPAIADVVVVVHEGGRSPRLAAFVITSATSPTVRELRDFALTTMPTYMVPTAFVFVDSFPITVSGKIDRKALGQWPLSDAEPTPSCEPSTPEERTVMAVWSEALGLTSISIDDDFFALGGDSLIGTRIVARLSSLFGCELGARHLYESPTIRELARRLSADAEAAPRSRRLVRSGGTDTPLSLNQERLLHRTCANRPTQDLATFTYRIVGAIDTKRLADAIDRISERHEILRARFPLVDGRRGQVITTMPPPIDEIDLSGRIEAEAEAERLGLVAVTKPLDVATDPPFRIVLIRLERDVHLLFLLAHHAVWDAASTTIFLEELNALLGGEELSRELPIRYRDFARWQRRFYASTEGLEQISWWKRYLHDTRGPLLPTDFEREAVESARTDSQFVFGRRSIRTHVGEHVCAAIRRRAQTHRVSPHQVRLAAFALLLHRLSGASEIALATQHANRHVIGASGIIGPFAQALVLRIATAGTPSLDDVIEGVRVAMAETRPFSDIGGSHLRIERFRINFNEIPDDIPRTVGELSLTPWRELDDGRAWFFDLTALWRGADEIIFRFNRSLWRDDTVEGWLEMYVDILTELAT